MVQEKIGVTPRSGKGFASGVASLPMLLECDRRGHILWLSERTRSAVGQPETLAEILVLRNPFPQYRFRIFSVFEAREALVLAVEVEALGPRPISPQCSTLRHLELKLLHAYFRLQRLERRLFTRSARSRRGGGHMVLRHVEVERQRLATELHTGVGQMLAAIRLQMEVITSLLSDPPVAVRQALQNISVLAAEALDQVRSVSRRLHPPEWQRLTIEAALEQLWTVSGIPLSFEAVIDLRDLGREPEPEVKALIYRTAQEGLANIIRHSKAAKVSMSLRRSSDLVQLILQDNGVGFNADALKRAPSRLSAGIGLRAITEQALALGAKIDIESGANGTKLVLITHFSVNPEL